MRISPELLAAAAADQTILAPNAELAAALFDAIERTQRQAGRELWSTPKVRDFGSWAREQHALRHTLDEGLPRQLSDIEERELWRQVIDSSAASLNLLDIGLAARAARHARRTVLEYAIPWRRLAADATDETEIFLAWNQAFETRCREMGCVGAEVRLADLQPTNEHFVWIESPVWRPAARQWLSAHARSIAPESAMQSRNALLHAAAPARELAAMAAWLHARLNADADFRAWIFVPGLGQRRAEIEDAFDAQMELRRFVMPGDSRGARYAVAGGTPLSTFAPVRAGLQLLQASVGTVTFAQFSTILRAAELQDSERDAGAAARIDLALRRDGPHESTLFGWLKLAGDSARQEGFEAVTAVQRLRGALQVLESARPMQRMSEWIGAWVSALNAGPWATRQRWSSVEFQAAQRFRELLAALAGAETFFGLLPRDVAQRVLTRTAHETAFQPQTGIPPIWNSGQPVDPWLQYDAVWLCGMSGAQWPAAVEPVALLPVALQRAFGVVAADADSQLAMSRELLARWQLRGEQCVFSFADSTEGRAALPSPLLPLTANALDFAQTPAQPHWRALKAQAPAMQEFTDLRAPPYSPQERTRGVATLRAQSRCAFRGFAEIRLAAERMEQPVPGFNDRERGELVHHALQEIWTELGNSAVLHSLGSAAQDELLHRAAASAVQAVSRRRDPGARAGGNASALGSANCWASGWTWNAAVSPLPSRSLEGAAQLARVAGLELKVRLDRVDRLADGSRVAHRLQDRLGRRRLARRSSRQSTTTPLCVAAAGRLGRGRLRQSQCRRSRLFGRDRTPGRFQAGRKGDAAGAAAQYVGAARGLDTAPGGVGRCVRRGRCGSCTHGSGVPFLRTAGPVPRAVGAAGGRAVSTGELIDLQAREAAVKGPGSILVQAPAGSGKTTLLAQRYLRLLSRVELPEGILALTFTRRAAQEMRERVIEALRAARQGERPAPINADTWDLAVSAARHLTRLNIDVEAQPGRQRIEPTDAFNAWLAAQLPITAGAAGLRVLPDARQCYAEAARRTLSHEGGDVFGAAVERVLALDDQRWRALVKLIAEMLPSRDRWLPLLAGRLKAAVALDAGQLLSLRGRFDEDLRLLVGRVIQRAHQTLDGELLSALAPILTRAANREPEALPHLAPWRNDSSPLRDTVDDAARWRAAAEMLLTSAGKVRRTVTKADGFPPQCADKPAMVDILLTLCDEPRCRQVLREIKVLPAAAYSDAQWERVREVAQVLVLAAAQLDAVFREQGAVDFTAISLAALRALGSPTAPTDLALKLDYRLQHILVDEFQDTSSAQLELLRLLTAGWQQGDGRSLFCVGDPMQSIYGFRQAEVRAFLELSDLGLGEVRFELQRLRSNFRSMPALVEWTNECFARIMPEHDDRDRGAIAFRRSAAARSNGADAGVELRAFGSAQLEAAGIAQTLAAVRTAHPSWSIAVLVRAKAHARELAVALRARGLAFRAVQIEPLQDRAIVRDVIMLTRALLHLGDRIAWLALLRAPWSGLTLADLMVLARAPLIWEALQDEELLIQLSEAGRARCSRVRETLRHAFAMRGSMPLTRWVESTWLRLGGPGCIHCEADLEPRRDGVRAAARTGRAGPAGSGRTQCRFRGFVRRSGRRGPHRDHDHSQGQGPGVRHGGGAGIATTSRTQPQPAAPGARVCARRAGRHGHGGKATRGRRGGAVI